MNIAIVNGLERVFNKVNDNKKVYGSVVSIESTDGEFSWTKSGGIISTPQDTMKVLKAFYTGKLFNKAYLPELYKWNRIQWFPLEYGVGMMRCKMSRLMSPLFPAPEILGHSGSTGSFTFYCPSKNLFITGTINQFKKQPFPLNYMLLNCFD